MQYSDDILRTNLKELKLHYTADNLEKMLASLDQKNSREMLSHLVTLETTERHSRSIARRMHEARIGRFKRMEDFNWSHPTEINRNSIEGLFKSDITTSGKNLIIIGTQGLGKTMIARNLASLAVYQGHTVRFVTASRLVAELLSAGHRLESRLRYYANVELLVIDELGYLSYQDRAADMLYEIVSRRYEKAPIILTSNLAFKEWPTIFPGAACLSAILDRLIHHCEILHITGDSYRKTEAKGKAK